MHKPLVSIVMPCRNEEKYLPVCLDSIQRQTLRNWELIIINDHSHDQSAKILENFLKIEKRGRVLHNPGNGLVSALNLGINHSQSEMIARMDADDIMEPQRLEMQVKHLQKNAHIELVSCQSQHFPKPIQKQRKGYQVYVDWTNQILTPEDHCINRFVDCPLAHSSVIFRKSLIQKFGGYQDGEFPEDFELWLRWMSHGIKMEKLPHTLLKWRDHPERTSRTDSRYQPVRFNEIKAKYVKLWIEKEAHLNKRKIVCWGAGKIARKLSKLLIKNEIRISAFIDLDPKKIGRSNTEIPILSIDQLPPPDKCFVFILVGSRGAREQIFSYLSDKGFMAGKDFMPLS